jgi:hypothetical protein
MTVRLDDLRIGELADAILELRRLREQVTELQGANNREVERRRRLARIVRGVVKDLRAEPWEAKTVLAARIALGAAVGACPRCGEMGDDPCRTENLRAALPSPHPERTVPDAQQNS